MNKISRSTFTIISNGFADGPSQALRDYLVIHKAKKVVTIAHPLVAGGDNSHITHEYVNGKVNRREVKLPNTPPYTYALDPFVPIRIPNDTVWFGFNNLACLRGLVRRKFGRSQKIVYWAVDFVPERFGPGIATKVYNAVDRYVCKHVDVRVELTQEGLEGRDRYLNIAPDKLAPSIVIPMGAWLARTPKTKQDAWNKKKIVYMGHIVERQGVKFVIEAMSILIKKDPHITLEVVGGGPDEQKMKDLAKKLKLTKNITFHGFVNDHRDVETFLADATIGIAPYAKIPSNFSVTSDPGKVKAYLGASLPMVLTDVPPIAKILEQRGAALLADDNAQSVAEAVLRYFEDKELWLHARNASAKIAKEFDWENILTDKLHEIGLA
jgi:glycosyltransferase involved in cell wall biosynthesis